MSKLIPHMARPSTAEELKKSIKLSKKDREMVGKVVLKFINRYFSLCNACTSLNDIVSHPTPTKMHRVGKLIVAEWVSSTGESVTVCI